VTNNRLSAIFVVAALAGALPTLLGAVNTELWHHTFTITWAIIMGAIIGLLPDESK
jgi:hypothetical protein